MENSKNIFCFFSLFFLVCIIVNINVVGVEFIFHFNDFQSMSTEENINKIKKNYMKKISEIFGQYGKVNVFAVFFF